MKEFRPYLWDAAFLKELDHLSLKEMFAKITVLDINEDPIRSIEGKISSGNINITADSPIRRTGNLAFLPDEHEGNLTDINNIIAIDKKIEIEIGYKNTLNQYTEYPVIWFNLGVYIITDVSNSRELEGSSINIQIQDKMCLLNGTCGGVIQAAVTLHELDDGDYQTSNAKIPIYQIIKELVNHFGGIDLSQIIISDVDRRAMSLLKWWPTAELTEEETENFQEIDLPSVPLYLVGELDASGRVLSYQELTTDPTGDVDIIRTFNPGENIGYEYTDLVFPGELIANAGQTVTDILDTIKNVLGNYEYYFDLDGNFRFQEIRNYLNTSESTFTLSQIRNNHYWSGSFTEDVNIYNFDNNNLITAINNNPKYSMIKNDYVVWGMKTLPTGATLPIRYHLAIDKKPVPTENNGVNTEDWRNVLYRQGEAAAPFGINSNVYYVELQNEWPKLYNTTDYIWNPEVLANPSLVDFFLDFIDTNSKIGDIGINRIGRRSKVVVDDKVNCVFAPRVMDIIIVPTENGTPTVDGSAQMQEAVDKHMDYVYIDIALYNQLVLGKNYKSAFSVVRDLLYQHTSFNTSVTLQVLPIYYLDVNRRIGINDEESGVVGNYLINSISVPLSISETMSINATEILEKI